jgi:hypothetical protein
MNVFVTGEGCDFWDPRKEGCGLNVYHQEFIFWKFGSQCIDIGQLCLEESILAIREEPL